MELKRIVSWVLGGLAIGTALRAVGRPAPEKAPAAADAPPQETPSLGPAAESAVGRLVQSDAVQDAHGFLSSLLDRFKLHATPLLAGALSYYAFLAIFPAAIATVSIYALVQDPAGLQNQIEDITNALPSDAASIVTTQLEDIVANANGGLQVGAAISILAALWAASAGMKALMKGTDDAYDVTETRNFLVLRGLAVLLTIGAIVFLVTAISSVTFLPDLLGNIGLEKEATRAVTWLRWPGLFIAVVLALGVLYKVGPNRPGRMQRLFSWGALVAALLWVLATLAFSQYVALFGNFNQTYGTLGGVIVLLLWFYISGFIVLLGAEVNSELEHRRHEVEALS
jgi:membrane protein